MNIRVIPVLSLIDGELVKTVKFDSPHYIGDPINSVRIFNELEVDELFLIDIRATIKKEEPNYSFIKSMATECFMPLSYGGGIDSFEAAKSIFKCGVEKVIINTAALNEPSLIKRISGVYGSQAVVVAIDVKKSIIGQYKVFSHSGTMSSKKNAVEWAKEVEAQGAGEIVLTAINHEGTWNGYDTQLIKGVSDAISIPVVAHGGAGTSGHLYDAVVHGASAVAAANMFLYQKKGMGVLINFPKKEIERGLIG